MSAQVLIILTECEKEYNFVMLPPHTSSSFSSFILAAVYIRSIHIAKLNLISDLAKNIIFFCAGKCVNFIPSAGKREKERAYAWVLQWVHFPR